MNTKILGSILTIGVALMMGVAGGMAAFSDIETSEGNTFEAGTLDLEVDFASLPLEDEPEPLDQIGLLTSNEDGFPPITVGGEYEDDSKEYPNPIDLSDMDESWLLDISDIKPGDSGVFVFSLHVEDNPYWLLVNIPTIEDKEGTVTEPEREAEGRSPEDDGGEMIDSMNFGYVFLDEGGNELHRDPDYDLTPPADQIPVDMELEECTTYYIVVGWWVPEDVGNEMQGDTLTLDFEFRAQQARHQDTYPWPDLIE